MPSGGGIVGDPYVLFPDMSTRTEFTGLAGSSYNYSTDNINKVVISYRLAAIPNSTTHTFVDQFVMTVPGHNITVGLSTVSIDGKAQVMTSKPITMATGSVHWWINSAGAGEVRCDIVWGNYWICVIQDPGTSLALHPLTSPLHGILHIGFLVLDYEQVTMTGILGTVLATFPSSIPILNPLIYLVTKIL